MCLFVEFREDLSLRETSSSGCRPDSTVLHAQSSSAPVAGCFVRTDCECSCSSHGCWVPNYKVTHLNVKLNCVSEEPDVFHFYVNLCLDCNKYNRYSVLYLLLFHRIFLFFLLSEQNYSSAFPRGKSDSHIALFLIDLSKLKTCDPSSQSE